MRWRLLVTLIFSPDTWLEARKNLKKFIKINEELLKISNALKLKCPGYSDDRVLIRTDQSRFLLAIFLFIFYSTPPRTDWMVGIKKSFKQFLFIYLFNQYKIWAESKWNSHNKKIGTFLQVIFLSLIVFHVDLLMFLNVVDDDVLDLKNMFRTKWIKINNIANSGEFPCYLRIIVEFQEINVEILCDFSNYYLPSIYFTR